MKQDLEWMQQYVEWMQDCIRRAKAVLLLPHAAPVRQTRRHLAIVTLTSLLSWALVALPLPSLTDLWRYWDGPMYMIVARTLYRVPVNNPITQVYGIKPISFAPFLLAYPLATRLLATLLTYHVSMIILTVICSTVSAMLFYLLLRDLDLTHHYLRLSILFLFIPYRWLIYRSVASTESMFLAFLFGSLLLFHHRRYFEAALLAALASVTRVQGILLLPTFLTVIALDNTLTIRRRALLGTLMLVTVPALLLGNAAWHTWIYGHPLVYFAVNQKLMGRVPFEQMLHYASHTVGPIVSMEGYLGSQLFLLLYGINFLGLARLWAFDRSRGKILFIYSLYGVAFLSFVTHEDLARYMIAVAPFTWLLGFRDLWEDRRVGWAVPWVILLTYLYTWHIIPRGGIDPRIVPELLEWMQRP